MSPCGARADPKSRARRREAVKVSVLPWLQGRTVASVRVLNDPQAWRFKDGSQASRCGAVEGGNRCGGWEQRRMCWVVLVRVAVGIASGEGVHCYRRGWPECQSKSGGRRGKIGWQTRQRNSQGKVEDNHREWLVGPIDGMHGPSVRQRHKKLHPAYYFISPTKKSRIDSISQTKQQNGTNPSPRSGKEPLDPLKSPN